MKKPWKKLNSHQIGLLKLVAASPLIVLAGAFQLAAEKIKTRKKPKPGPSGNPPPQP